MKFFLFRRDEKKKFKKLQKEVEKMAAMMKAVEDECSDEELEEKEEEPEDEETETEEEESEESESDSESETESQSEDEVVTFNFYLPLMSFNIFYRALKIRRRKIILIRVSGDMTVDLRHSRKEIICLKQMSSVSRMKSRITKRNAMHFKLILTPLSIYVR